MRIAPAILASSLLVVTGAIAADTPPANPDLPLAWMSAPTTEQVAAAYPAAAKVAHQTGKAVLNCKLQPDGRLRGCKTLSETPAGSGFGDAALSLVSKFTGYTSSDRFEREVHIPVAFSDEPGTPRIVIGPTAKDYQPMIAKAAGDKTVTKAEVLLNCKVGDKGVMSGCTAASETPKGLGVGDLAVQMSPKFISTLWGPNGRPTLGATVKIPLEVAIRDDDNLAATTVIDMLKSTALSSDLVIADNSSANFKGYYPERALSQSLNGEATVKCKAAAGGALSDCAIAAETPSGMGFGTAAMKIVPHVALKPSTAIKPNADGIVLVPFSFKVK